MIQLILHLLGDFVLQTESMAVNKHSNSKKGYFWCTMHCLMYTLPFSIIATNWYQMLLIFGTHFVIDKYNLATIWTKECKIDNFDINNWLHKYLVLMVDMTFHLMCNYAILKYV